MVELTDIAKRFRKITALDGVNLAVNPGEFFSILGPSGCGKSTLLRVIAGLEIPNAGAVRIEGVDTLRWPPHRRPVNMVFQSYALFPHMSVAENVGFGPRMRRLKGHVVSREVMHALGLMRLVEVAARMPSELSGGQRQRVALARAIANEPKVLLLDEPLGALDLQLRRELQLELRHLQHNLGITFIHVTHDQDEALSISDRVAVMNAGRIEQVGTPQALYEHPRTPFVAGFVGSCNVWPGKFLYRNGDDVTIETPFGKVRSHFPHAEAEQADRNQLTIAIRPEKILLAPGDAPDNRFKAMVQEIVYQGATTQLTLARNDVLIKVSLLNSQVSRGQLSVADDIEFYLPPENLLLLNPA